MALQLDHLLVPCSNKQAAAQALASILGVAWAPARAGPFTAVQVSAGLRIDVDAWTEPFPAGHDCFRASDAEFDAVLQRLAFAGMAWRSLPHGPVDHQVNASLGSRTIDWSGPGGHVWELRAVSDARGPG